MTVCIYCGTPCWRYASRQDLCEKCGRFPPMESQAGLRRNSHNDRMTGSVIFAFKPAEFKAKREIQLTIENRFVSL
jgi:hypothetical protein